MIFLLKCDCKGFIVKVGFEQSDAVEISNTNLRMMVNYYRD